MSKNKGIHIEKLLVHKNKEDIDKQLLIRNEYYRLGIYKGYDHDTTKDFESKVYVSEDEWLNDCEIASNYIEKMQKVPVEIEKRLLKHKLEKSIIQIQQ